MFLDSTKIIVVESTVSGADAGPKKGSTGYIVTNGVTKAYIYELLRQGLASETNTPNKKGLNSLGTSMSIVSVVDKEYKYCFLKCYAYFTRFGFEKKERLERKEIINVFPIKLNTEEDTNKDKIFLTQKVRASIRERLLGSDSKLPIVIAVPNVFEKPEPLIKEGKRTAEFEAWATSVLSNKILKILISASGKTHKTGIFSDNNLLALGCHNKTQIKNEGQIDSSIKTMIPPLKDLNSVYVDDTQILRELRIVQNFILKTALFYERKLTAGSVSQEDLCAEAWTGAYLTKKANRSSSPLLLNNIKAIHNTQQYLLSVWSSYMEKKFNNSN